MNIPENVIINYHSNGRVQSLCETDHRGGYHGIHIKWNKNGVIISADNYVNNKLCGLTQTYNQNGNLLSEISFDYNSEYHGIARQWFPDGKLEAETPYVHGKVHGRVIICTTSGKRLVSIYCNDGNITSQVKEIVADIHNITDCEKTQIALQFGLIL